MAIETGTYGWYDIQSSQRYKDIASEDVERVIAHMLAHIEDSSLTCHDRSQCQMYCAPMARHRRSDSFMTTILYTFTHTLDGITSFVVVSHGPRGGYSVTLCDDDSGEMVGFFHHISDLADAITEARSDLADAITEARALL